MNYSTLRLDQFCGSKNLSEITTGQSIDVIDGDGSTTCRVWSTDYETSSIEDDSDGREMVSCSFYRDSVATESNINFLRESKVHFYAGFNIFEESQS